MAGVGRVLARRAVVLGVALILIVILTGVIMEATGYAEKVWLAIIDAQVRAYNAKLKEKAKEGVIVIEHGSPIKENMSYAGQSVLPDGSVALRYTANLSIVVTHEGDKYYYPSGIEITLVNQTVFVNTTGNVTVVEKTFVKMVLVRPDGAEVVLFNGTVKPTLTKIVGNDTGYAIIKVGQSSKHIIPMLTDYYYEKYRDELLNAGFNETEAYSMIKAEVSVKWPQLIYSEAQLGIKEEKTEVNGTTVIVKKIVLENITPINGTYRLVTETRYESGKLPSKLQPAEIAVVDVGAPSELISISTLVRDYREELKERYGLNKPWWARVIPLVEHTLVFDLGETNKQQVAEVAGVPTPARVADIIMICLPRTIVMVTIAEIICMLIALPMAPRIAYHYGSILDRAVVTYAAVMSAIPVWWLGMVFIYLFAYQYRIFPPSGRPIISILNTFDKDPWGNLVQLASYAALPIITIVITFLGGWFYSIRAVVLKIIREDFVTVAKAKGLPENIIARRYILRVVAPPITTYVILALAGSLGGFIITESVFDWPGMGSLYYAAINSGDVATILGLTYIFTLIYVIARFLLEVLYILLDPRVRL